MTLRARKQFFVGDTSFGFSGKEASPTLALYISSPGLIGLDDVSLQALKRHGLNREQYWAMFEAQGGGCAICKESPPSRRKILCVDHNHTTGEVRSLLCSTCNSAFGLLKENPERICAMLAYAEKWKSA